MPGLSRFDFYPRDWISGTRELSDRARGVYVDLIARMYDLGRALDHDERELCRFLGYRDYRQLRPVLGELVDAGKVIIEDGELFNDRAMREIDAAQRNIANGKKGGRPHKNGTSEAPARHQQASSGLSQGACSEEDQGDSGNPPSPSPPPLYKIPPTEGAEAPPADLKTELYRLGKTILGKSVGGQVTRLLQYHRGDIAISIATLRLAESKADPAEYVGAILKGDRQPETDWDSHPAYRGLL